DSVDTRSQHHDTLVIWSDVVLRSIVGQVQVVGLSREFSGNGIDLLNKWSDASVDTKLAGSQLRAAQQLRNLSIRETNLLGRSKKMGWDGLISVCSEGLAHIGQSHQFVKEPAVDLGQLVNFLDGVALIHSVRNGEHTLVRWKLQLLINRHQCIGSVEAEICEIDGPDSLLNGFLKSTTNTHDLTNRFHRRVEEVRDTGELLQIPSWNLDNDVDKGRFETGAGDLGYRVFDFIQRNAKTEFGSNESQWVTSSFGSQSRRTGKTGVDLDDTILVRVRV